MRKFVNKKISCTLRNVNYSIKQKSHNGHISGSSWHAYHIYFLLYGYRVGNMGFSDLVKRIINYNFKYAFHWLQYVFHVLYFYLCSIFKCETIVKYLIYHYQVWKKKSDTSFILFLMRKYYFIFWNEFILNDNMIYLSRIFFLCCLKGA